MNKITAIVPCYNEAENIAGVLETLQWADEILVVDSFSTDDTVAIAKRYTNKIFQRKYKGPADQKNWIIPQASHDWIILLDADERLTPELESEIKHILKNRTDKDAFWIGRQNYFMGKKLKYSGWQGDAVIRLFKKSCRYDAKQVHEEIQTEGINVGKLNNKIQHFTFKSLDHYLDKTRRYAKWSAKDHFDKTKNVTLFHLYIKPLFRFFKHYFFQLGFLDGRVGFIVSAIMAWGVFLRYVYLKEMKQINLYK